jgi:2'-5' RNA ligase
MVMRSGGHAAPSYRLFYALKPTLLVARQTDHFADLVSGGCRRIRPEHQHVTLAVTADHGQYPYGIVKALMRAGTSVSGEPFDLPLDRLAFTNRSAALRPSRTVQPLVTLHRSIVAAMNAAGVPLRPGWSFSPHQTLFYRDGKPEQRRVDGFTWQVEEFVLICSHVGLTRHDIVGSWPLQGSGQFSFLDRLTA